MIIIFKGKEYDTEKEEIPEKDPIDTSNCAYNTFIGYCIPITGAYPITGLNSPSINLPSIQEDIKKISFIRKLYNRFVDMLPRFKFYTHKRYLS